MNYYNEIKKELVNNEIYKKVKDYSKNKSDLNTYYNVGALLVEAQGGEERAKYGDNLIKEYSNKIFVETKCFYNVSALKRMRQFYLKIEKGATLSHQLTWSHYVELLSIEDKSKINYYIKITEEQNLSIRELRNKIKNCEYERLDDKTKNKLLTKENNNVEDFIKNPIVINNRYNYSEISERILKSLILEDMSKFLEELGEGFCFVKDEYKIKLGDRYNYIDLLLF